MSNSCDLFLALVVAASLGGCDLNLGSGDGDDDDGAETDTPTPASTEGDDEPDEPDPPPATTGDEATGTTSGAPPTDPPFEPETGSTGGDLCPTFGDGVCDEPQTCAPPYDYWDCGYCPWPGDGLCDEGTYCPEGTDPVDCGGGESAGGDAACTELEAATIEACAGAATAILGDWCLAFGSCAFDLGLDLGCVECATDVGLYDCATTDQGSGLANWWCVSG